MIERIVRDWLAEKLAVPVCMEIPANAAGTFVLVEKTGSGRENHILSATLALQSYAPSLFEAAALNKEVKTAMDSLDELDEVCRVQLNSDYNFTDTAAKRYRYQAVYDLTHY